MERQGVDKRAKAQALGPLSDGGQEHARRWRHPERREVVLRDMISVKAGAVESLDHLQPMLVIVLQRQVIAVQMIENPEIHAHAVTTACIPAVSVRLDSPALAPGEPPRVPPTIMPTKA